jgi:hypothetical protein
MEKYSNKPLIFGGSSLTGMDGTTGEILVKLPEDTSASDSTIEGSGHITGTVTDTA